MFMYYIFLFLFITINSANADAISVEFHLPQTQAEKTLDIILQSNDGFDNLIKLKDIKQVNKKLYEFVLKNGKKQLFDKVKEFLFTKELIDAIEQAYIEGEKDCLPGDQCLPGYNVFSCSQDSRMDSYIVVLKDEGDKIYLAGSQINSYKLIKIDNEWKLDGIKCSNDLYHFS